MPWKNLKNKIFSMDRREALKISTAILAYSMSASATAALISSCAADTAPDWSPSFLNDDQVELLAELCEIIIPSTDMPGAKDALTHRYIDMALYNNYSEEDRLKFLEGIENFDQLANEKYELSYTACAVPEKNEIMQQIAEDKDSVFRELRSLTVSAYVSSEVGTKQFLAYDPVPGEWNGCIDFDTVNRRWA
jgi:hypothetical protein